MTMIDDGVDVGVVVGSLEWPVDCRGFDRRALVAWVMGVIGLSIYQPILQSIDRSTD